MKCFGCERDVPNGSNYCSHCGRQFRRKQKQQAGKKKWPHPESVESLATIEAQQKKDRINLRRFFLLLGFVIWGIAIFANGLIALVGGAIVALPVLLLIYLISNACYRHLSPSDYYSIPHSHEGGRRHRCVYCGNGGIWKQGQYKTNHTHHHCSRCEAYLFTT